MTKRLRVLFAEDELEEIQAAAAREHVTVAEWVRQALRAARGQQPAVDARSKLESIQRLSEYGFPTADVEQMIAEIARGYRAAE